MDKTITREQIIKKLIDPSGADYINCLIATYKTLPENGVVFTDYAGVEANVLVGKAFGRDAKSIWDMHLNKKDIFENPIKLAMKSAKKKIPSVAIMHERTERVLENLDNMYEFITKKPNYVIPVIIRKHHKVDDLQGRGVANVTFYFKQYFEPNEN